MTDGPDPSGIKVLVTPSGKELWPAKVLAEDEVNLVWVVEKGNYKYQLQPDGQVQK